MGVDDFDWIVVGAGAAGCVVAARLAARGDARVLLLEAGPDDRGRPTIAEPARWAENIGGPLDWGLSYAPQREACGRAIPIPRGRVTGGSSAINALLWYRGHPSDYDAWGPGWSFADVLPVYRRIEDWQDGADPWRGAGGPMRIERTPDPHPLALDLIAAAGACGLPPAADQNGATNEGAAVDQLTLRHGRRWSAADAWLRPALARSTLTLRAGAVVTGLIMERGRCVGVRCGAVEARAPGVVLTAGALMTPKLLMLAGVGPADALRALGLPVVADLPVGATLRDHPLLMGVNFRARRPLGALRGNGAGAMLNWRSAQARGRPDLHAFMVQRAHAGPAVRAGVDLSGPVFGLSPGLMDSRSCGALRLTGPRWDDPLDIDPAFLTDPADMAALLEGLDLVTDLAAAPPLAAWIDRPLTPSGRLSRTEKIAFVRRAVDTFFHPCGTAPIGSVLDSRLAVRGVEGLWAADASAFPDMPTCNTLAPTLMLAERAADFLTGEGA